jgi:hypothetical protein
VCDYSGITNAVANFTYSGTHALFAASSAIHNVASGCTARLAHHCILNANACAASEWLFWRIGNNCSRAASDAVFNVCFTRLIKKHNPIPNFIDFNSAAMLAKFDRACRAHGSRLMLENLPCVALANSEIVLALSNACNV